ncbi:hypothetical protein [Tuwongella immobilis]|uniref:Uncharacterized protein n=1 Tax=Tuwongella immobilis TaxID=692036 RepID=A0A6C2YHF2_9BACT|nr:hypothetical protein [Tuwongella immobilis]VIP00916.1 unnamed protein product [Tuwongella immobilis]VTR97250.1 unnamed protein product [Tuwongella immobilis]
MLRKPQFFAAVLWITVFSSAHAAPLTFESVIQAHQAARESIISCSCRYTWEAVESSPLADSVPKTTGVFEKSPTGIRIDYSHSNSTFTLLRKNNIQQRLQKKYQSASPKTFEAGAEIDTDQVESPSTRSPWSWGLLTFPIKSPDGFVTLEHLISKSLNKTISQRSGQIVIEADLKDEYEPTPAHITIFISPEHFLATKVIMKLSSSDRSFTGIYEIKSFSNQDNVYFPTEYLYSFGDSDNPPPTAKGTVTSLILNKPISNQRFQINYPGSTPVRDKISGTQYIVSSDGMRISPEEKLLPPMTPEKPTLFPETKPQSLTTIRVIVIVAVVLIFIALIYMRVRNAKLA